MTQRLKTISKIARIIDHQKEVIELQVREIVHLQSLEKERLALLRSELYNNIDHFEERIHDGNILDKEEVTYLFGMSSTVFRKMEQKIRTIDKLEKELEALQSIFLEAYKKKKAIEIVQNKIKVQERKTEVFLEQKNLDYLNLSDRSRP